MATKQQLKDLYNNPNKQLTPASWRRMIDFLYGKITTITTNITNAVTPRATPQQITHAENVDAYIPPIGFAAIQVVCRNGEFGNETEYLFPTHVIYNKEIKNLIIVP